MSYPQVHATITKEQREWIKAHPEINVSGLLQKGIIDLMNKEKEEGNQPSKTSPKRANAKVKSNV